ncbi:hypothetical protein VKT23_018614 [Stygiomarasmius scandens]|uniref:Uncharacterized protein n=1 Tax=Marasmiellus scandens TaxID=2682957 RepID=A0ABR1INM2_9AGAR
MWRTWIQVRPSTVLLVFIHLHLLPVPLLSFIPVPSVLDSVFPKDSVDGQINASVLFGADKAACETSSPNLRLLLQTRDFQSLESSSTIHDLVEGEVAEVGTGSWMVESPGNEERVNKIGTDKVAHEAAISVVALSNLPSSSPTTATAPIYSISNSTSIKGSVDGQVNVSTPSTLFHSQLSRSPATFPLQTRMETS